MCLYKLLPMSKRVPKYGYKVYKTRRSNGRLYPEFMGGLPVKIGQWLKADQTKTICTMSSFDQYNSGFHVFTAKREAEAWADPSAGEVVRKVLVDDVTAFGLDGREGDSRVMICGKIKVLPDEV